MMSSLPPESETEVLIIGGRAAGASLAARLGEHDVPTVVVDRARFPSLPSVPSSAMIYAPGMALLEEQGIDESSYGDDHSKIRRLIVDFDGKFSAGFPVLRTHGRDYAYGVDRSGLDHALWTRAGRHPSVSRHEGTSLVDVLRDRHGTVVGALLRCDGQEHRVYARCVVGADGRFSTVARKVGAEVREDAHAFTSTTHYALWEGVEPVAGDPPHILRVYASGRGAEVLMLPVPGQRIAINTHVRSDRVEVGGDVSTFYRRMLDRFPVVRRRLANARQVSRVVGIKRIGNRYLQTGGPGWVLTGDAVHHKDPIDGQGIYDALALSKLLAHELLQWRAGRQTWDEAVARYEQAMLAETHPMFESTVARLERELHGEPHPIAVHTVIRWMMQDSEYQRRLMAVLARALPPGELMTPRVLVEILGRGVRKDLRRLVDRLRPRRVRSLRS